MSAVQPETTAGECECCNGEGVVDVVIEAGCMLVRCAACTGTAVSRG